MTTVEKDAPRKAVRGTGTNIWTRVLIASLIFLGVCVLLYPYAAQWFNQRDQSRANARLAETMQSTSVASMEQTRAAAEAYNQSLRTGIGYEDQDYFSLLDPSGSGIIGRLRIPSIDLDQPIRHGMGDDALSKGLGHLPGTSLPIGGASSHAVIGGHKGLVDAVGFTHLDNVKIGDEFYLEALGEVLAYKIVETKVIEPEEADIQPIQPGRDLVTLITCTPLGVNSHRFVAIGERILPTPAGEVAGLASHLPHFPWWALTIAVSGLTGVAYVFWPVRASSRINVGAAEPGLTDRPTKE